MNKLILYTLSFLITCLLGYGIGLSIFTLNALSNTPQATEKIDTAIILTGGENRIKDGLKLLQDNKVKAAFISGVDKNNKLINILPKSIYNKVKQKTHIGYDAQDTVGNAEEVYTWLEKQNATKSFYLVTSTYHMPRAHLVFKHHPKAKKYLIKPYPISMEKLSPSQKDFWNLMFNEYNKFIYTWITIRRGNHNG